MTGSGGTLSYPFRRRFDRQRSSQVAAVRVAGFEVDVPRFGIKRFPYAIIVATIDDTQHVVAVAHPGLSASRDRRTPPGGWRYRPRRAEPMADLVVQRGSRIIADGTRSAPIVFTSSNVEGMRGPGDWAGIRINGRAPINSCATQPCEAEVNELYTEATRPTTVAASCATSGSSSPGWVSYPVSNCVGSGAARRSSHIQVYNTTDDGIEFVGGTADARYILATGAGDDSVDWEHGWRGRAQFNVAQQWPGMGDNGIQAENDGSNHDAHPRLHPMISNVTLIGVPTPGNRTSASVSTVGLQGTSETPSCSA